MEDEEEVKNDVIFVGNLPKHITEDEIHTYFKQFGKILSIRLVKSAKTNLSRGYCYVKFESPSIASIAAEAMNNYFIEGRALKVNVKTKNTKVKHLFKKGPTRPPAKTRLMIRAMQAYEDGQAVEAKMQDIIRAVESNQPIEASDDVERIKTRLRTAITRMQKKQVRLNTDIYEEAIKKYRAALDVLNTAR